MIELSLPSTLSYAKPSRKSVLLLMRGPFIYFISAKRPFSPNRPSFRRRDSTVALFLFLSTGPQICRCFFFSNFLTSPSYSHEKPPSPLSF